MGHGEPPSSPGDAGHHRHATFSGMGVSGVGPNRGDPGMTHDAAFWFHCFSAIARRPDLWFTALRQIARAVPTRWWTRPPFAPIPDPTYIRFRLETAYGSHSMPRADDVVRYLEWCRAAA